MTAPPALRRPGLRLALAAGALGLGLGLATASPAVGVPSISGADTDVWNASQPTPTYTITASNRRLRVFWALDGGAQTGDGRSPLTVKLPDLTDGAHKLAASEGQRDGSFSAVFSRTRAFRVDLTPPTVTVTQPVAGSVFDQGATVLADYACAGAVTCAGPVASGSPIATATAGTVGFRVTAMDDAGNQTTVDADYAVLAPPPPPTTAAAAAVTPPAPTRAVLPPTINARVLHPRKGATIGTRRPLLRWPALARARLYNLQIFRLGGTKATKVLSVFPRASRYRVPPRTIAFGGRYAWRVWPYLAAGYPKRPLGLSFFGVRTAPRP